MPLATRMRARRRPAVLGDRRLDAREPRLVDEVGLGDHDQVGAAELVLEQLLDRVVVLERKILRPLLGELCLVGGDAAFRHRRRVDHRDHAVDGHAVLHARPGEGLHQRLRQREARRSR